jgi:hypothetical protein
VACWGRGLAAERGVRVLPGTLWPASSGQPKCRENATCIHDRGNCVRPVDRRGSSSVLSCGASWRGVRGNLADRITAVKKSLSCVTTRRRKLGVLNGLRHGLHLLAARFLVLGVPGFDVGALALFGLSPRRIPTPDLAQAFRILTVALVVTARMVFAPASFAQTNARARTAPSGPTVAFSRNVADAHGRLHLPRESSGRVCYHSPRAISKLE